MKRRSSRAACWRRAAGGDGRRPRDESPRSAAFECCDDFAPLFHMAASAAGPMWLLHVLCRQRMCIWPAAALRCLCRSTFLCGISCVASPSDLSHPHVLECPLYHCCLHIRRTVCVHAVPLNSLMSHRARTACNCPVAGTTRVAVALEQLTSSLQRRTAVCFFQPRQHPHCHATNVDP